MLQWMSANGGTILISLALAGIVALIIRSLLRQKRQGKSSCGCNCAHCAMYGACHTSRQARRTEKNSEL